MTQKRYSETERERAIAAYLEHGADTAAAEVGCNPATVYRWLGAAGVSFPDDERGIEARAATVERHRAKREALLESMLDTALFHSVASMQADNAAEGQRHAVAFGIFHDKLHGTTSAGTGTPTEPTLEVIESWITKYEIEAQKVHADNRTDQALREAIAELENRIRADAPDRTGHNGRREPPASI